jgi:uncharacterized protein YbjT (DUF2867 family)
MSVPILVTGATGNVGSAVVAELLANGRRPRVFVRDRNAVPASWTGVDVAVGDFDDAGSMSRALAGVRRVFVLAADGPDKVRHESAVVDAAVASGVEHVVKLSARHAAVGSPLPCFDWHGQVEEHLAASGIGYTNLRPAFFMENMLMIAPAVAATGQVVGPAARARTAMIAIRDVAASAAAALTHEGPLEPSYELTGPAAIDFDELAAALSRVTGRQVSYVELTPEEAQPRFDAQQPEWLAAQLSGVFGLIRAGAFADVTDGVSRLTGRPARTFEDFATGYAQAFAPRAAG